MKITNQSNFTLNFNLTCSLYKLFPVFCCFLFSACSTQPNKSEQTIADTIPITMANVRGHEEIYKKGWFVVSSSEKALRYAEQHGGKSALEAIKKAQTNIASRTDELGPTLKRDLESGINTGRQVLTEGTGNTKKILNLTKKSIDQEKELTKMFFNDAYSTFVTGYLTLGERTSEDLNALRSIPGGYFDKMESDFTNIAILSTQTREKLTPEIESSWSDAFKKGKQEFANEYQKSGEKKNSISGLGNIIKGYGKAIYYAVISPGADNLKYAGTRSGFEIGNAIALPTSALLVISGRTVQSLGMSLWYTTSTGIKLVSPTVEGGLLTGMSLLSSAAIPVTAVGGASAGVINQVAVVAASPVAATSTTLVQARLDTAKYSALVAYDITKATTRVTIEELSSGLVLGYNALTALPAQTVLGATSGVFFLAWDGPRLVIAYATGTIKIEKDTIDISELPVGSVVDLNKLKSTEGIQVKIISDDEKTINNVLQSAPEDMQQAF